MKTTISLDEDVLQKARAVAARLGKSFQAVINETLRESLADVENPPLKRPYQTTPRPMGLKPGRNLDNIQELLSEIEGEDAR